MAHAPRRTNHGQPWRQDFRIRLFVNPATTYTMPTAAIFRRRRTTSHLCSDSRPPAQGHPRSALLGCLGLAPGIRRFPGPCYLDPNPYRSYKTTVQTYTQSTLAAFKDAGVMPDIVQIGNETTSGIMWPTGQLNFSRHHQPAKKRKLGGVRRTVKRRDFRRARCRCWARHSDCAQHR